MSDIERRLADLEARFAQNQAQLREVQDQLEITRLLISYGPAVDSGCYVEAAELWVEDGVYDAHTWRLQGRKTLSTHYDNPLHNGMVAHGVAHVTTTPRIDVTGDTAEATAYTLVVYRGDGEYPTASGAVEFNLWRAAINYYTLRRTSEGWRIVERYNRVLDGSEDSFDMMKRGVDLKS